MSMRPAYDGIPGIQRASWLVELLHAQIRLEILAALAGEPRPQRGRTPTTASESSDGAAVEADVGSLAVVTGRELSHVSQHLVQLLAAGLLVRRIVWKRHHYRLAEGVRVAAQGGAFKIEVRHPDGGVCALSVAPPAPVTRATDQRGVNRDRAGNAG